MEFQLEVSDKERNFRERVNSWTWRKMLRIWTILGFKAQYKNSTKHSSSYDRFCLNWKPVPGMKEAFIHRLLKEKVKNLHTDFTPANSLFMRPPPPSPDVSPMFHSILVPFTYSVKSGKQAYLLLHTYSLPHYPMSATTTIQNSIYFHNFGNLVLFIEHNLVWRLEKVDLTQQRPRHFVSKSRQFCVS